jgi:hypothetical protein
VCGDASGPTWVAIGGARGRATDGDVARLGNWLSLQEVRIDRNDLTAAAIRYLKPCSKLRLLAFGTSDSRGFEDQDIKLLESFRDLTRLELAGCRISRGAMERIGHLTNLEELRFNWAGRSTPVTDELLACLGGLRCLTTLDLSETTVTGRGIKYLRPLKALRCLDLLGTAVWEAQARGLVRVLPALEIHTERWNVPATFGEGSRLLAAAYRAMPNLARLSRHALRVEVHPTATAWDAYSVITVYTDNTDLADREFWCFERWPLQSVTLAGPNLTARVLRYLGADTDLRGVSLHLAGRGFEPSDIEPLGGRRCPFYLCLEGNSAPEGVMVQIGRLTNIDDLDLTGCPVTDAGLAHLSGLGWLGKLSVARSKVTAEGLHHLAPLTQLRFLDLSETAVRKDDVRKLHQALPELNIYGGSGQTSWEVEGTRKKCQ